MRRESFEARLDPASFAALLRGIRAYDVTLAKQLRARIRLAAEDAAQDVRRTLREPTPAGTPFSGGVRGALAAGTKVSILTGARRQGVRIVTRGSQLPAGHEAMLRLYNRDSFRHPVRGNREKWVSESGRPYFGRVLARKTLQMRAAVETAVREAAAVMEGA